MTYQEGRSALIIDENPVHQILLQEVLYELGYGLITASDWVGGLAIALYQRPQLILADIDRGSAATHRRVAELDLCGGKDVPLLIGMTAPDPGSPVVPQRGAGFHGFVQKPFTVAALQECIERAEFDRAQTERCEPVGD